MYCVSRLVNRRYAHCFLARLPFKRLNPELKGNRETKRARGPPVSSCLGSGLSDGENDANDSSPPLCHRPPVVNGRGPLDGFVIKKKHPGCPPAVTIDLTEDSNSSDTVHQRKPRAVPEPSPPTDERIPGVLDASHPVNSQSSVPTVKEQSDGHMEKSDLQENTVMEESMQEDSEGELRHESGLLSSPASSSSLSTAESSPEANKSAQRTPSFIEVSGCYIKVKGQTCTVWFVGQKKCFFIFNISIIVIINHRLSKS